ncbi:DivIVA domain-containing protein [Glutamicibacter soli]|uniref:Cell wall synthesis protein Wag31 n=1 Tax=Glutamicibacter soli TaxID=453836 RepID=A0A6L9FYC4_9MICC|nr:DivIVA domain-containing protein [Glutamicibacter soli]NAZ14592.1 DivIVA domain-containing protein [Glutamicibacter soli]
MALTPEDVVNKRFQPTKFREGYDQDEVDDFLDEIVVELRRLTGENETLRRRLSELGEDANVVAKEQAVPAPVSAAPAAKPAEEKKAETKPAEEGKAAPAPAAKPAEEKKAEPAQAAKPAEKKVEAAPAAAPAVAPSAESAANVLAMAQRLHDEYVASGVEQRDKIISDAKTEANSLVTSAEEKSRKTLSALEQQKSVLERKLEQLRGFERDYRARLKTYIEGQLRDLESQGSIDGAAGKAN